MLRAAASSRPSEPGGPRRPRGPRASVPPRRTRALLGLGVLGGVLAGCSSALPVEVAPYAADPVCAEVVLALPQDLEGMARLGTGSQATAAWGTPEAPVVLRCGVEPPGPSTDQCVTADDGSTSVDWLAVPDEAGASAGAGEPDGTAADDQDVAWTFTTYGRDPAVEVRVPAAVIATRSSGFLIALGPAIEKAERTRSCL